LDQIIDNLVPLDRFHIEDNMPRRFNAKILVDQVLVILLAMQSSIMIKKKAKLNFYQELADFHEFTIRDNGPGISENIRKRFY
jgi:C4-dicarboxylate-specific signal transduction histidine kinase